VGFRDKKIKADRANAAIQSHKEFKEEQRAAAAGVDLGE